MDALAFALLYSMNYKKSHERIRAQVDFCNTIYINVSQVSWGKKRS